MKKTAIKQLIDFLGQNQYFIGNDLFNEFARVQQINKEQIKEAFNEGKKSGGDNWGYGNSLTGELYYKETYKK